VDTAFKNVTVIDVEAKFSIDSANKPEFCFKNESVNAVKYTWIIEDRPFDDKITNETNPCHTWGERVGTYKVCLVAESAEGCLDTTCELVNNQFFLQLIPYNVFTPKSGDGAGDGKNDLFKIKVKGADEYEIKIFNRWGELVYESSDPDQGWDGTIMNKGTKLCPEGAYFYIINYTMKNRQENDGKGPISGTVTLIREK
jgi:gliding motility-associated-like protein